MQGLSLETSVSVICGGASVLTALLCLLSLVSLLSARSADAGAERAAAFAVGLMALAMSLAVFWSASPGAPDVFLNWVRSTGLPLALFQIQASVASVVVALLAWRFPDR